MDKLRTKGTRPGSLSWRLSAILAGAVAATWGGLWPLHAWIHSRSEWLALSIVLLLVSMLAAALVLLRLFAAWVLRPLEALGRAMARLARGDHAVRMPPSGHAEVADLMAHFNRMAERLEEAETDHAVRQEELAVALRDLEKLDRVKDSFLSLVSHEVRTPLTSILASIDFLAERMDVNRSQEETVLMDVIRDSGQRLAGFMNDAILMASLQASNTREHFEELSLTALIGAQLDALRLRQEEQQMTVCNHLEARGEIVSWGDWTMLQVALEKVLHNAFRHGHTGGRVEIDIADRILETSAITVSALQEAREVELPRPDMSWRAVRVFNSGPLIPPEKINSIFHKFELVHDIAHHHRGSGLSLPIVLYICRHHGGGVEVWPVGDEGMAFYLILPMREAAAPRDQERELPKGVDSVVEAALSVLPVSQS